MGKSMGGKSKEAKKKKKSGNAKTGNVKTTGSKKAKTKSSSKGVDKYPVKSRETISKAAGSKNTSNTKKKQNPNLKLIKNGDLPVEKSKKEIAMYVDKPEAGNWYIQHKSLIGIGVTVFVVVAILACVYYYLITNYEVTTVYVDGNIHYTNEEVMDMVMTGRYGKNSMYLAVKYRDKGVEGIPFIEKMDVNILTPNTIRINVYEKAVAGYVEYLGRYMYFDKDGIVVESSEIRTSGIPQVMGLKFDYVVLNEPLPVENEEIFRKILSITQLLEKYELTADKIFFDSSYELTLYFDDVRVTLGSSDEIDEKIMRIQYILPELEGKRGILQMENYTEDTKNITFNED